MLVIPWASNIPDANFSDAEKKLTLAGAQSVIRMPNLPEAIEAMERSKKSGALDPQDPRYLISSAGGIWITGGDQALLFERLVRAKMLQQLQEWIGKDIGPVGGTSAGCAVMSKTMIGGSGTANTESTYGQDHTQLPTAWLMEGVGALANMLTDQHYSERRKGRLEDVLPHAPRQIEWGIGVDESTAVLVTKGRYLDVFGKGTVTLIPRNPDGSCAEKIALAAGQRYDLKLRLLIPLGTVPENADHYEILASSYANDMQ